MAPVIFKIKTIDHQSVHDLMAYNIALILIIYILIPNLILSLMMACSHDFRYLKTKPVVRQFLHPPSVPGAANETSFPNRQNLKNVKLFGHILVIEQRSSCGECVYFECFNPNHALEVHYE